MKYVFTECRLAIHLRCHRRNKTEIFYNWRFLKHWTFSKWVTIGMVSRVRQRYISFFQCVLSSTDSAKKSLRRVSTRRFALWKTQKISGYYIFFFARPRTRQYVSTVFPSFTEPVTRRLAWTHDLKNVSFRCEIPGRNRFFRVWRASVGTYKMSLRQNFRGMIDRTVLRRDCRCPRDTRRRCKKRRVTG